MQLSYGSENEQTAYSKQQTVKKLNKPSPRIPLWLPMLGCLLFTVCLQD